MNNDLISRSKAIEELNYLKYIGYDNSGVMKLQNMEIQRCISVIESVPAVEERPQGDSISREALKKALELTDYNDIYDLTMTERLIDNAPTVDIKDQIAGAYNEGYMCGNKEAEKARPQGEWIKVKEERMSVDMSGEIVTQYKCSKCGRVIATFPSKLVDYYPYCRHCGADMQKGGAE